MYGANKTFGDLTGPPRIVPLDVKIRVIFGHPVSHIGWGFFGFGMIFVFLFVIKADFSPITFRGDIVETDGQITKVVSADYRENDKEVYALHFTYAGQNGIAGKGISYCSGEQLKAGDKVRVEYIRDDPGKVRVKGMRRRPASIFILCACFFPGVGFVVVYAYWKIGVGRVKLLVHGGYNPHAKITDESGVCTTGPLVYDLADPDRVVWLSEMPGTPHIDSNGVVHAGHFLQNMAMLITPIMGFVVNSLVVYFKVLK